MRQPRKLQTHGILGQRGRRPKAVPEMDRSVLDESALWSRHRYVAQESLRESCDCNDSMSDSGENGFAMVASVGVEGKRNTLHQRKAQVSRRKGWSTISFGNCDI